MSKDTLDESLAMLSRQQLSFVVSCIEKHSAVLIGANSSRRFGPDVDAAWESIWSDCVKANMPFCITGRDSKYLSNVVWQNMRRGAMVSDFALLQVKTLFLRRVLTKALSSPTSTHACLRYCTFQRRSQATIWRQSLRQK